MKSPFKPMNIDLNKINTQDARRVEYTEIYDLLMNNHENKTFTKQIEPIHEVYRRTITDLSDRIHLMAYYLLDIRIINHPYEFYLLDCDLDTIKNGYTNTVQDNIQDNIQGNNCMVRDQKLLNFIRKGDQLSKFPSSNNGYFNARENPQAVAALNNIKAVRKFNPEYAIIKCRGELCVDIVWDKSRPNISYDPTKPIVIHETGINFVFVDTESYLCALAFAH